MCGGISLKGGCFRGCDVENQFVYLKDSFYDTYQVDIGHTRHHRRLRG